MISFQPTFLLISTLLIGCSNLIAPFLCGKNHYFRNIILIGISILYFANILLLDYLFLNGIEISVKLLDYGKYSVALNLEALGMIFLSLISLLWIFALLYTIKFLSINHIKNSNRFLFFTNSCIMIGSLIALSENLLTMFIGYELLTLCTIPLVAHQGGEKIYNGLFKYLKILMLASVAFFLPAIIIIYSATQNGSFIEGGILNGYFSNGQARILLLMFVFGIAKSAIYPFHNWLPAAMVASYPVSALLHAVVVVKAGLFCIYKILIYVFGFDYLQDLFAECNWLVIFPIITILYSSVQSLKYNQIKMILAYSTINQLSIALMSAFMLTPKAMIAAVMHMVSHAFTKIVLFYCAGNMYSLKNVYNVSELIGIYKTLPKTSYLMLIAGLSLIGIPPFAGFISKFYIFLAAAEQHNLLVMITLVISSIFSALYMIKILIFVFREQPNHINNISHKDKHHLPSFMIISVVCCTIGIVGFFFISQAITQLLLFI